MMNRLICAMVAVGLLLQPQQKAVGGGELGSREPYQESLRPFQSSKTVLVAKAKKERRFHRRTPYTADRVRVFNDRVNRILLNKAFDFSITGIMVKSLKYGQILFQKDVMRPLIPASVTKIILTSAFLHYLYPSYQYQIEVFSNGKHVWIKPYGDPLIDHAQIWTLLQYFKFNGIKEIKGDLILDLSAFDVVESIDEEFASDLRYNSALSPFSLGFNAVFINVMPATVKKRGHEAARLVGEPARIYLLPDVSYFEVQNQTQTVGPGQAQNDPIRIRFFQKEGKQKIVVSGSVDRAKVFYTKISNPIAYIKDVLKDYLFRSGIVLHGGIVTGITPKNAKQVITFPGRMIPESLRLMNSYSNNFMAEQLLMTLGGEVLGYPSSISRGVKALAQFLVSIVGIEAGSFQIENASGLTRANRFAPAHLIQLLEWNYRSPYFPDFLSMIADAPHTAVLEKRMRDKPYKYNLRVKTGTLDDVSCVAGYFKKKDDWIALAIMINQARKNELGSLRAYQDMIIDAIDSL